MSDSREDRGRFVAARQRRQAVEFKPVFLPLNLILYEVSLVRPLSVNGLN